MVLWVRVGEGLVGGVGASGLGIPLGGLGGESVSGFAGSSSSKASFSAETSPSSSGSMMLSISGLRSVLIGL